MIPPLQFSWDGESLHPTRPALADRHYVVGETYMLVEHHERSEASHRQYFASINEAWQSLPDDLLPEYPSPEHLRKKMLIKAGYFDGRDFIAASRAEALRLAAWVRPMDDYAVIIVKDNIVRQFTAKSQSFRAMGKTDFQESKAKVLDAIYALIGVKAAA